LRQAKKSIFQVIFFIYDQVKKSEFSSQLYICSVHLHLHFDVRHTALFHTVVCRATSLTRVVEKLKKFINNYYDNIFYLEIFLGFGLQFLHQGKTCATLR
jgi:hypothetical protein